MCNDLGSYSKVTHGFQFVSMCIDMCLFHFCFKVYISQVMICSYSVDTLTM